MNWYVITISLIIVIYVEISRRHLFKSIDKKIGEVKDFQKSLEQLNKMVGDGQEKSGEEGNDLNECHTSNNVCGIPDGLQLFKRKID
jgi:hypothetical protein